MRKLWLLLAGGLPVLAAVVLVVSAEPGNLEGRLFFGVWRTRHVGAALILVALAIGAGCAATSRRAVLRYAFVWLQAALALIVLETVGWLGLVSYPRLLGNEHQLSTNALAVSPVPHLDVCGETHQDIALTWGLAHEPVPFCYRTNRHGFRNPPDLDDADVYLLGDSIVVSAFVPWEGTIAARLTREWQRPVMNVALIAVSPQEEHEVFRDAGLPVDGRLVLQFLFEGNDLADSARYARQQSTPETPPDFASQSFSRNAVLALQRVTQPTVAQAARFTCGIQGEPYVFRWAAEAWEGYGEEYGRILASVEAFATEVREGGGEYALVFVPSKLRVLGPSCDSWPEGSALRHIVDANPFRKRVRAWASGSDIALIDLTDRLRRAAEDGNIPWHWGDTHWNEIAQEAAAATIAEAMREGRVRVP